MTRFMLFAAALAGLVCGVASADDCSPIQFGIDTWMVGSSGSVDAIFLANDIGERFLNHGIKVYDAGQAKENNFYARYDIEVTTLRCEYPPGDADICDLLVSVYDWQGVRFRSVWPPSGIAPCDPGRLIHSKVWHVQQPPSYWAAADYYYDNHNAYPGVFFWWNQLTPDDVRPEPVLLPKGPRINRSHAIGEPARTPADCRAGNSARLEVRAEHGVARVELRDSDAPEADGTLSAFDVTGRRVASLRWPAGSRALEWDMRDARGLQVRSGVYLLRLVADRATAPGRMVVVR